MPKCNTSFKEKIYRQRRYIDMDLKDLSKKPELVKITIDSDHIKEKYGDELEFHVYDRQDLSLYAQLSNVTDDNIPELMPVMEQLILDSDGQPVMQDGKILPIDVMMEALKKVGESLGKQSITA